tara:strand:- start:6180 stop:6404 length:225 start_codon:yes stop_codon:yes gene_type:complete
MIINPENKKAEIKAKIRLNARILKISKIPTFKISGLPIDPHSLHLIPTYDSVVQSLHMGLLHLEHVRTVSILLW